MENRWGHSGNSDRLFSWAPKLPQMVTAAMKRLFLGRNIMTKLDSILKSRDIILPAKVHLVKAMVFPSHVWMEKEMATYSSILAWRIPGMEEPGWLPSMGLQRVGHDWSDWAAAAAACMDVRVGLQRKLSAKELMLLNCSVGEDSWESPGLQDPTSQS